MRNNFRSSKISEKRSEVRKLAKREEILLSRKTILRGDKKRGYLLKPTSKNSSTYSRVPLSAQDQKNISNDLTDLDTELFKLREDLKDARYAYSVDLGLAGQSHKSNNRMVRNNSKSAKSNFIFGLFDSAVKNGSKDSIVKIAGNLEKSDYTDRDFLKDLRPTLNKYKTTYQRPVNSVSKDIIVELKTKVKGIVA